MPKRTDIKSILIIGAGPIVIGQACEFDYSGTQACKALRAEGLEVVHGFGTAAGHDRNDLRPVAFDKAGRQGIGVVHRRVGGGRGEDANFGLGRVDPLQSFQSRWQAHDKRVNFPNQKIG